MEQLTVAQAIKIHDSKVWKDWDSEKIVKFQLFQDRLCVPFDVFHQAIEEVLGRPVYTHELGFNYKGIVEEYLGTKEPPTLDEIIALIPEDKRLLVTN